MTATNLPETPSSASQRPTYWRSASQLTETSEFRDILDREFPEGVADHPGLGDGVSRRGFMTAVAASIAATGLTSCRKPYKKILPYTRRPEYLIPGVPNHYATALTLGGYGVGALVRSNEGRPTKIEGNPDHPSSLGASSTWFQAELLNLYDPGRSREPVHGGATADGSAHDAEGHEDDGHGSHGKTDHRAEFRAAFDGIVAAAKGNDGAKGNEGAGLHVLMPSMSSPTANRLAKDVKKALPQAKLHRFDSAGEDNVRAGARIAFGKDVEAHVAYDQCSVVAAFDADFMGIDGNSIRAMKDWSKTRRIADELVKEGGGAPSVSRLYVAESSYTVTGGSADHRFRVAPSQIPVALAALAAELGLSGALGRQVESYKGRAFVYKKFANWVPALAKDLLANQGKSAVVVGPRQPAAAHAMAHAINEHLKNVGKTVTFTKLPEGFGSLTELRAFAADLNSGNVETAIALGCNPIYDAPADLEFDKAWAKAKTTIHFGLHVDETAAASDWHCNSTHELEAWGDTVARDGTIAVTQPLIAPLYEGVSPIEVLAALAGDADKDEGYKLVQSTWSDRGGDGFVAWWKKTLHDGFVAGTGGQKESVSLDASSIVTELGKWVPVDAPTMTSLELEIRPDNSVLDGRYSNNPWMQEVPDPLTKLTWDNALLMSRKTAMQLGLAAEDGIIDVEGANVVKLTFEGRSVEGAAWVVPGHADGVITTTLGYGRSFHGGEVAAGTGHNAGAIRTSQSMWGGAKLTAAKTGASYELISAQDHGSMEGRALHRTATFGEYQENPSFAPDMSPMAKLAALKNELHEKHELEANAREEAAGHAGEDHAGADDHAAAGDGHEHSGHEHSGDEHGDGHHHQKTEKDLLKSLWTERYEGEAPSEYQWGMTIDLNSCNGCNACVVACTSENNISMVGKDQVKHGREMFWTRIDRYFTTARNEDPTLDEDPMLDDEPGIAIQKVPCMQCENAPCESVCPVAATVHSPEGLNDMAYNRCIGTRYCANNCPYKVRRFNWFNFNLDVPPAQQMAFNPNVTVRARGVMEKCTYCVQRINVAKIQSKLEDRKVRDGDITPACAQSCPAEAITFGNIADPESRVSKLKATSLDYGLLSEMNMKPRTTYLGKVTNPNPELVSA